MRNRKCESLRSINSEWRGGDRKCQDKAWHTSLMPRNNIILLSFVLAWQKVCAVSISVISIEDRWGEAVHICQDHVTQLVPLPKMDIVNIEWSSLPVISLCTGHLTSPTCKHHCKTVNQRTNAKPQKSHLQHALIVLDLASSKLVLKVNNASVWIMHNSCSLITDMTTQIPSNPPASNMPVYANACGYAAMAQQDLTSNVMGDLDLFNSLDKT